MGRVLFISILNTDPSIAAFDGVMKKLFNEIHAFESYGNTVDYTECNGSHVWLNQNGKRTELCVSPAQPYQLYNQVLLSCGEYIRDHHLEYDFAYIRHGNITFTGYMGLKRIKKCTKAIYLELPAYTRKKNGWKAYFRAYMNQLLRLYIYKIVTYSIDDAIYGIPTIKIINGVDTTVVQPRNPIRHEGINVVFVASMNSYHGIDRLLKGVKEYKDRGGSSLIVFHIVGQGSLFDQYVKTTEEYHIQDMICFHGKLAGSGLDAVYDVSDIGISTLAAKDSGYPISNTIKSKEYLAKGLPILADTVGDVFYHAPQYFFHIIESKFNVDEVISFYNEVYGTHSVAQVIRDARNLALEKCDMKKIMKAINDDYMRYSELFKNGKRRSIR